eukprot:4914794-Pyramimonas_sp.AAC.1
MFRSFGPASNTYHCDCSALGHFVTWTEKALAGRTPQARYWRPAARTLGSSPIPAMCKVKAHLPEGEAQDEIALFHIKGNSLADHFAGLGKKAHGLPQNTIDIYTQA